MQHRIFIAINLPENIKTKLLYYEKKWLELPIRWTKKENLHITLTFIGYVNDEELVRICQTVEETIAKNQSFFINLKKIIYGPKDKKPPRMVWVEGEKSEELGKLQKELESDLANEPVEAMEIESRPYSPHITLGRIKTWEWRKIEPEERPEVNEDINFDFQVSSIEVMESKLKRGGPDYIVLQSCPMKR